MIEDIALIALHLAHATDDELAQQEVEEMSTSLQQWRRDETEPTALAAIKSALETYVQAGAEAAFDGAVERMKARLSVADRAVLVADLTAIALADGTILDAELDVLNRLSEAWGVESPEH